MEELDELLLLSGNDIPFPDARLNVHQPRIKEIALIHILLGIVLICIIY